MSILTPSATAPTKRLYLYLTPHRLAELEAEGQLSVFARFRDGAYATGLQPGVDADSNFDITFVAG